MSQVLHLVFQKSQPLWFWWSLAALYLLIISNHHDSSNYDRFLVLGSSVTYIAATVLARCTSDAASAQRVTTILIISRTYFPSEHAIRRSRSSLTHGAVLSHQRHTKDHVDFYTATKRSYNLLNLPSALQSSETSWTFEKYRRCIAQL